MRISDWSSDVCSSDLHGDRSVDVEVPDLGAWRGRQPVLADDIASSGRTLIEAARKVALQGFAKPVCAVIHGIFAEDSYERLATLSRSEEHTSELQSLMRISYAVFCLKKKI